MLKVFTCECGFSEEREHPEYYGVRIRCPRCNMGYVFLGQPTKLTEVLEDSIRALSKGHAEKAAEGFAQGYELWLKHIIGFRDSKWLEANPKADIKRLRKKLQELFGVSQFTIINKKHRNLLEHDPVTLTTRAAAMEYAAHVLGTMEKNLVELMGEQTWRLGETRRLDTCSSEDSEEHVGALLTYWHHYRSGTIGYTKTFRAWWTGYRRGKANWHQESWCRQ